MKPLLTLVMLIFVALIGAAGLWFVLDEEATHELAGPASIQADSKTSALAAELSSGEESANERSGRSSDLREVAGQGASAELTKLKVSISRPEGAPADDTLVVHALSRSLLEGKSPADWLAAPEGEYSSAKPNEAGVAELEVPVAEDLVVLIDGKYLFLDGPIPAGSAGAIGTEGREVSVAPRLGAFLSGEFATAPNQVIEGSVAMMGMNFGARGGGSRRVIKATEDGFEFRAIDTELTWMLLPELESGFADSQLGLELEAGGDTFVNVSLLAGATVRGIVTDEAGLPLAGAKVEIVNPAPWIPAAGLAKTESDEKGEFVLTGVAPGKRKVQAQLEGRVRARTEDLELADGQELAELRLVLELGATIRGTVHFPDGTPAADAFIEVETMQSRGFGGFGGARRTTVADGETKADGSFLITGLSEGSFTLRTEERVSATEGGVSATWRATQENVAADSAPVALVLSGPVPFSGRVVDDLGEPVTAFRITARSVEQGGPRERAEFTDEEGRFTFAKAGAGDWRVTADAEGHSSNEPVELKLPGEETELVLTLARTATVSGRVVDPTGTPVTMASVQYILAGGDSNPWRGPSGPSVKVDGGGGFLLEDLRPGVADLTASADGWADSDALSIELPAGEHMKDVVLTMRVGGRITGSVLTPEGDPLTGQRVTWGSNSMGFGSNGETKTAGDGSFEFRNVTPGDWSVSASPSMAEMGEKMRNGDAETAWVDVMGQLLSETITIADGETVEVYLGGEPRVPVRIVGAVTRGGEPVEGAQVYAVSEGSAVFQGMKTVRSTADGTFEIVVDRPGAYVVSARDGAFGVEVVTDIPRAAEARVDLPIPLGRIEGFVEKPDGKRAAGIRLRLQREDGLGRMRWGSDQAVSNEDGAYSFDALEPGSYTVRANIAGWNGRADDRFGTMMTTGVEVRADSATSGINFDLEEAGSIEGIVESTDGVPLAGVSVFFRNSSGVVVTNVSSTTTDGAGRFEKKGLGPGDYTLSARGEMVASEDQVSVRVSSKGATEARLVVESGTRVRIVLEDAGGDPRRARIEIFDKNDREVGGLMTLGDMQKMFNEGTSSLERVLGPLAPGRYTVRATTVDGRVSEKKVRLNGRRPEKSVKLKLEG